MLEKIVNETNKNRAKKIANISYNYLKDTITEKVELITNPKKFIYEMKELAIKEGPAFMVYAIAVEITEDVITPIILAKTGYSEYIPIILAGHSEPFMYPLYFGVRKAYRTIKKRFCKDDECKYCMYENMINKNYPYECAYENKDMIMDNLNNMFNNGMEV